MLCRTCVSLLRGGLGPKWNGTYDPIFRHHTNTKTLRRSQEAGCAICDALANELQSEISLSQDQHISVNAHLSRLRGRLWEDAEYRLDFELDKKRIRTFVLRPTGTYIFFMPSTASDPRSRAGSRDAYLRTPKSSHTSSDEVFELAQDWISECRCATSWQNTENKWYPRRLLDIQKLRSAAGVNIKEDSTFQSLNSDLNHTRVRLVEEDHATLRASRFNRFVTLSHCWGPPAIASRQIRLTSLTEERFRGEGIEFNEFTKTFRDALLFASRLDRVGYVWIDSLCIIQPILDQPDHNRVAELDWLEQSQQMGDIYREAYLNISATAAVDGEQGLFFPRQPDRLWEDEVNLNVGALLGPQSGQGRSPLPSPLISPLTSRFEDEIPPTKRRKLDEAVNNGLRRCIILDASSWQDLVDDAPINQRAWVFQERFLAPRVLHFCADRIAWECAEFDRAEGKPEGVPTYMMRSSEVVYSGGFKRSMNPEIDGKAVRESRLRGLADPDEGLPNLYVYELWKRIVERYSRSKLTMSRDRLIALSGIARLFHDHHLIGVQYVAGMWNQYLESQLLWRVEPVFKNGVFQNHSTRDPICAPSFSWASINAPQGIVYGEATNYGECTKDLFFRVIEFHLSYVETGKTDTDAFSLVKNENNTGYIKLEAQYLRKIILRRLESHRRVPYGWWLDDGTLDPPSNQINKELTNVCLDAPDSDVDIFSEKAELYCMPAAYGERTVKRTSRYLMCFLLHKLDNGGNFKRIGMAKLSNYADGKAQRDLLAQNQKSQIIFIR